MPSRLNHEPNKSATKQIHRTMIRMHGNAPHLDLQEIQLALGSLQLGIQLGGRDFVF